MTTIMVPSDPRNFQTEQQYQLDGQQVTVATATIAGFIAQRPLRLQGLRGRIANSGTGGTTTIQVHKNGSLIAAGATVSVAGSASASAVFSVGLDVGIDPGDAITMVVSSAATGGAAGLVVSGYVVRDV